MLIRGPTGFTVFGMACSHVRWHDPPITSRSPWWCCSRSDLPPPRGRSAKTLVAPKHTIAVVAVAIEAQPRGGEGFAEFAAVSVVESPAHLLEHRMRNRFVDQMVKADQAGHIENAVIHLPALGPPRDDLHEFVEQRVRVGQPARAHLDPCAAVQVLPLGGVEERALKRHLHAPEFIAHAFE